MYNSYFFQNSAIQKNDSTYNVEQMSQRFAANMAFFARELPAIHSILLNCKTNKYALFINDIDLLNIRDNSSGEALYGSNPVVEVEQEVNAFLARPLAISHKTKLADIEPLPLPDKAVVMLFGVGCGYHLKQLLLTGQLAALLIYEADVELLKHSLNFVLWQDLLEIANKNNVLLAIQPDYAVADIKQHLAELETAGFFGDKIYLYRHTYHRLTEEVIRFLRQVSGDRKALLQGEGRFLGLNEPGDYLPVRPAGVLGNMTPSFTVSEKYQRTFNKNLEKLQQFYPDIAEFYKSYQPTRWQFCIDDNGVENIFHHNSNTLAYSNTKQQANALAQFFLQNPFRESAIYAQSYQPKLAKYIHFKQVAEVEKLQKLLPVDTELCNEDIRTLAFFGTGLALHIEATLAKLSPRNIFIFEEDPDLFYASLYVTDWAEIIDRLNTEAGHLYLNIGCSPDSYLNYFLYQLYIVGPYEISNTFLFPCYFRPHLQKAIAELREQLKTFIALNEYYDNARYGITHFLHNAENHALVYRATPPKKSFGCPVFIVGNGPSLDTLIEHIKQHQEKAIVISCGTALKALYEYGITPDFHAEVEQNGATYNWITKVPDRDYLKSIHLLSSISVFPETAKLFKTACLAFGFGQTPFKMLAEVDDVIAKQMGLLKYAFPTVSNFALNMALSLGFQDVYLFGVDLGFSDVSHHHSKKSAYYTAQGLATYDYAKRIGRPIAVKGNFSPYVYTKFEFNMARRVMEQVLLSHRFSTQVYNCSDGAFIQGATPLSAENLLITSQTSMKSAVLNSILTESFTAVPAQTVSDVKAYLKIHTPDVAEFIRELLSLLEADVQDKYEITQLIAGQVELLRTQHRNKNVLAYNLLEGSVYSFLGVMNSFKNSLHDENSLEVIHQLITVWRDYLCLVQDDLPLLLAHPCPVANLNQQ